VFSASAAVVAVACWALSPVAALADPDTNEAMPPFRPPSAVEVRFPKIDYGATPMASTETLRPQTFRIPAPRSVVVSRDGAPLAVNRVARRLVIRLAELASTSEEAVAQVRALEDSVDERVPFLRLSETEIERHFSHRPWFPLAVTAALPDDLADWLDCEPPRACSVEPFYHRVYPEGELTAHLLGYTGVALPDQRGPIGVDEFLWPVSEGRAGMELAMDETFRGEDGELLRLFDESGALRYQRVAKETVPGDTLVLSINLEMQRLARERLVASRRPGAFVAIDADTGDILALVSHPTFDPNLFEGGISSEDYQALTEAEEAPLFDRAVTGAYPPGSTFKSFVALAGLDYGAIDGTFTRYSGPPSLMIAGRSFRNWNSSPEGVMDVRYALVRSCNTWFYQAALDMGAAPIYDVGSRFGFGLAPELPHPAISAGNLPEPLNYSDPRSLANYAIGQGRVLVSPVQLAYATAAIANGDFLMKPRLVVERRDARTGELSQQIDPEAVNALRIKPEALDIVRDGLWGVVNHGGGTARGASMRSPVVYAKTGTSQWSVGGRLRSLAWFAGWLDAEEPRIAFVAVTQGRRGERLSGGGSAAPIAMSVLRTAYAQPDLYAVTLPEAPSREAPALVASIRPVVQEELVIDVESRGRPRGRGPGEGRGLLRFLFGGRR